MLSSCLHSLTSNLFFRWPNVLNGYIIREQRSEWSYSLTLTSWFYSLISISLNISSYAVYLWFYHLRHQHEEGFLSNGPAQHTCPSQGLLVAEVVFILSSVSCLQCNQLTCIFHENTPKEEKSIVLFRIKANQWFSLKIPLLKSWCSDRKHSLSTTECLTILIKVYSLWVFFLLGQGPQAETKSRGTEGELKVPATTWLLVKPPLLSSLHLN